MSAVSFNERGLLTRCGFTCARVAVLDGGLPAWKAQGLPVDESPVTDDVLEAPAAAAANPPASTKYRAKLQVGSAQSQLLHIELVCDTK